MCARRALRARGVSNVAYITLITRGTNELRVASTQARRLVSVRCNGRGFAVAVCARRALRARGVSDVADSTLITRGSHELRVASTQARRLCSVRCNGRGFAVAVRGRRALCARGVVDAADTARIARCTIACTQRHPIPVRSGRPSMRTSTGVVQRLTNISRRCVRL